MTLNERIQALRVERRAVILAHNYQDPSVQDIADFVGDSLELSRKAAATDAELIVFCGVYFMAETAAILSPHKTVLIPDLQAGCPMVEMAPVADVLAFKRQHPGATVVTYVNSSAAVKAESDVCCTSANAVEVVQSLPADTEIVFLPDRNLGAYVASKTGRPLHLYPGFCPTHARILDRDIARAREAHPGAAVLVHPECRPDVVALADAVLSTSGMCRYVHTSPLSEFIVATETNLLHRLQLENPGKRCFPASEAATCPNMRRISVEQILWSLEDRQHVVCVPEEIRVRALRAVERMVAVRPA